MTKTVMAFGSFDLIHLGHILYLERARALGDRLIVVVARDKSIEMFKKRKPLFSENDRLKMIKALKPVDMAVLGNKLSRNGERVNIIKRFKPDIIALGYDQKPSNKDLEALLKRIGVRARIVRIRESADEKRYKSSIIRKGLSR
jgi:FAD synthetase